MNSIPLSAVERVEILKDGASAIYGTDAIAGVVNFILRKDFQGLEATAYGGWTEHGGGNQAQATVTAGYGDLAKDRFNVFATVSYQKDQALANTARPYTRTGYLPDEGIINLSPNTFPANICCNDGSHNPSYASGCAPPSSLPFRDTTGVRIRFRAPGQCHSPGRAAGASSLAAPSSSTPTICCSRRSVTLHNEMTIKSAPTPVSQFTTNHGRSAALPRGRSLLPDGLRRGQRDFRRPQPVLPNDPARAASHRRHDLRLARRRRRRGDRGRLDLWRGADLQPQSTEREP